MYKMDKIVAKLEYNLNSSLQETEKKYSFIDHINWYFISFISEWSILYVKVFLGNIYEVLVHTFSNVDY